MKKIWVLHGPNLNLLGTREPERYGKESLTAINRRLISEGKKLRLSVRCFQSNAEGELIDFIHDSPKKVDGLIFNPGAYTHTSIAIRDALSAVVIPTVEVHLTNIYSRESFRRKSLISPVVLGTIGGFGAESYLLALRALANHFRQR